MIIILVYLGLLVGLLVAIKKLVDQKKVSKKVDNQLMENMELLLVNILEEKDDDRAFKKQMSNSLAKIEASLSKKNNSSSTVRR